jgi:hypothetical protein
MGRILVEMDMIDEILVELEIDWCGNTYQQRLDYLGSLLDVLSAKGQAIFNINA